MANKKFSLTSDEYKRYKALKKKIASGSATDAEREEFDKLAHKHGDNDVSWWTSFPSLIKDTANFVFNHFSGTKYILGTGSQGMELDNVLRLHTRFVPGMNANKVSAYNTMMSQLWLYLHRIYRGMGGYAESDLGIMIWCVIMVFTDLARAMRIYAAINTYSILNRNIPYALVRALGLDTSVLSVTGNELSDFRANLNRLVIKASTLCLPKGLPLLAAYTELMSNVFKDAESNRATVYCYDTSDYVVYDPTFATGGRALYKLRTGGTAQTLNDVLVDIETQMNALVGDSDVARMCSDLVAALKETGVVTISPIEEYLVLEPVYNDIRSLQLHNTSIINDLTATTLAIPYEMSVDPRFINWLTDQGLTESQFADTQYGLYQCSTTNGFFLHNQIALLNSSADDYQPKTYHFHDQDFVVSGADTQYADAHVGARLLDCWEDDPTVDLKVEMSRQTAALEEQIVGGYSAVFMTCAHMYVREMILFNGLNGTHYVASDYYGGVSGVFPANWANFNALTKLEKIDWCPIIYCDEPLMPIDRTRSPITTVGDIDNATVVRFDTLYNVHEACMYSACKFSNVEYTIREK